MAYRLRLHEGQVLPYLRGREGLSRNGRVRLFTNLHLHLGEMADSFRQDPERRLAPGSHYFWFDIIFRDEDAGERLRHFWCAVSDAAAQYGILLIDYVEEGNPFGPPASA